MKKFLLILLLAACTSDTLSDDDNEPVNLFDNCDIFEQGESSLNIPHYGGIYPTPEAPIICGRIGPNEYDVFMYHLDWFAPQSIEVNLHGVTDPENFLAFDIVLGSHDPKTGELLNMILVHRAVVDITGETYVTGLQVNHNPPWVYQTLWIIVNTVYIPGGEGSYKYQLWN